MKFSLLALCATLSIGLLAQPDTRTIELETALVVGKAQNVAWQVVQKVMAQRNLQMEQTKTLQCSTYAKSSYVQGGRSELFEFLSYSQRVRPGSYREFVVAADQHLTRGPGDFGNSVEIEGSFSGRRDFMDVQRPPDMGQHFFEGLEDGDFEIYAPTIYVPKVLAQAIPSPIASDAGINYRFDLVDIISEDQVGNKVYVISFESRSGKLMDGQFWIQESDWHILKSVMVLDGAALTRFEELRVEQTYQQWETWTPPFANIVSQRQFYWKDHGDTGTVWVQHSDFKLNANLSQRQMGLAVRSYASDAFDQSNSKWEQIRPQVLAAEEVAHVAYQDSLALYYDSDTYIDSVDREYNSLKWYKPLLSGMGYRSRTKGISLYLDPLIAQFRPFGIGGYRHNLGGSVTKIFDNDQRLSLDGYVNYGFANRDLKGEVSLNYRYDPRRFGDVEWAFGDDYMMVNTYESIMGTFARGNYARRRYFTLAQRMEWFNGVYVRTSLDFSERSSIADLAMDSWSDGLFGSLNAPKDFPRYTVAIAGVQVLIRPFQRYIFKRNRKFVLGSDYPDIEIDYRWGIPGLFGSDVNYHQLRIETRDFIQWPRLGYSEWSAGAGSFFGSDLDSIRFIEHKYFRGSDQLLFSSPTASFQALDSTYHTARAYLELYAIHHFQGALLERIPLLNRLNLETAVGGSAILIPSLDLKHVETFIGLEHVFRINKQLMKWGIYRVFTPGRAINSGYEWKMGINIYDSYRGRWLY
ncbi:MAG: DUF5686 family protein [Schleiferiaceae bacterium]|nr:DUF5686 family protein [Schleiferiaceae bacterium]